MANLKRFRELVTKYRKPATQMELADTIGLTANELSHRLGGTGRSILTQKNVLDIVVTLAKWQSLNWEQAVELLDLMDYPLDTFQWKTRLQEHLSSSDLALSPMSKGTPSAIVPVSPQGEQLLQPRRRHLFHPPILAEGYVSRPDVFQDIKRQVLEEGHGQTIGITTALRGAGGFGKTTLATALCQDTEIQAAFEDILWIELGEHPPQALDLLNRLLTLYENGLSAALTLQEAQERWRFALQDRAYLLVIDDVWQQEALAPLLQGGTRCRHLVTTRNDVLLPRSATRVVVDAMTRSEAVQVLCQDKALLAAIVHPGYRPQLEALAERLGLWPLLLMLARGMLTEMVEEAHATIAEALTTLAEAYEICGVTAFRLDNVEERQRTVDACLRVSLQHLETFTHAHYHATERYQELAVFPEDDIPLSTLQTYWKERAGLQPSETKDLCIRLRRLSLLLRCDLGTGTIRLHEVVRSYLIQRVGNQLPTLHQRLLDAFWKKYRLTRWSALPQAELYLWWYLATHLVTANRVNELLATMKDGNYLASKTYLCGTYAIEIDLAHATQHAPSDPMVPSLTRFFRGVGHLLSLCRTRDELASTLHAYLLPFPELAEIRTSIEHELVHPFLAAYHPLPDQPSQALIRTLIGHGGMLRGCAISPSGEWIVSCSDDKTLKLWDVSTGLEFMILQGHTDSVWGCAVSPSGERIVSCSEDKTLKVWDVNTGQEFMTLEGHTGRVNACAVSPDEKWIVSCSDDGTLRLWDMNTGLELMTLQGHKPQWQHGCGCAVSPDGAWIVSYADHDTTLWIWDAHTGQELMALRGDIGGMSPGIYGCTVSPDGTLVAACQGDGVLQIWDAHTGQKRMALQGHSWLVSGCAFSPDGKWIVSCSRDKMLKVWDVSTGRELMTLPGHTHWVSGCAVSPNGEWIVSCAMDGTLKLWDAHAIQGQFSQQGHTDGVFKCAVSPDGAWSISCSRDGTLKKWDMSTGQVLMTLDGHSIGILWCAIDPSGKWIFSRCNDGVLTLWDAQTGQKRFSWEKIDEFSAERCTVSPSGKWIVFCCSSRDGNNVLKILGQRCMTLASHTYASDCVISPSEEWIVSWSLDGKLKVWDVNTGQERMTLQGHTDAVNGCAISPSGEWIVSCSADKTLKVWDVNTGLERMTLQGHAEEVNECTVSPDGKWIVSCSHDETLKLWSVSAGTLQASLRVDASVNSCVFSPDGQHIVAGGDGGVYFLLITGVDVKTVHNKQADNGAGKDVPKPEVHSPDQSDRDVTSISSFRRMWRRIKYLWLKRGNHLHDDLMAELAGRVGEILANRALTSYPASNRAEMLLRWTGNAIIFDPGAKLWQETVGWHTAMDSHIIRFALTEPLVPSFCYNPLKEIRRHTPEELADFIEVVELLVNDSSEKGKASDRLLLALLARYMEDTIEPSLCEVAQFIKEPWLFYSGMQLISYLCNVADPTLQGHLFASVIANEFKELDDALFLEEMLLRVRSTLSPFTAQPLGDRTRSHDLPLTALIGSEKPTTLYITFPEYDVKRLGPILRLLCSQFARGLRDAATPHSTLLVFDGAHVVSTGLSPKNSA